MRINIWSYILRFSFSIFIDWLTMGTFICLLVSKSFSRILTITTRTTIIPRIKIILQHLTGMRSNCCSSRSNCGHLCQCIAGIAAAAVPPLATPTNASRIPLPAVPATKVNPAPTYSVAACAKPASCPINTPVL